MKRLICILAAAVIFAVGFAGCIESPVEQQSFVINGKLYGHRGYDYLLISAGLYPVNYMGWNEDEFHISAVKKPYDMYIYASYFNQLNPRLTLKYSNIQISDLNIIVNDRPTNYFYPPHNYSHLDVYFPILTESKYICLKFISNEDFIQSSDDIRLVFGGQDHNWYAINLPENKQSISGKLYFMEIKINPRRLDFVSFDKFGIKDVTLYSGGNAPVIFTEEELSYNPAEYLMPVTINLPPEFTFNNSVIYLSVPSMNKSSDLPLYRLGRVFTASMLIPILPNNLFKIKVYTEYSLTLFDLIGNEFVCVNPGEPANLDHKRTINILSPANDEQNVTDSTSFTIADSDAPAVYEYSLCIQPEIFIRYYSANKNIKLSDFRTATFSPENNKKYFWQARKFPKFTSTDEFLIKPYVLDNRYDYIELSEVRSFTTAP